MATTNSKPFEDGVSQEDSITRDSANADPKQFEGAEVELESPTAVERAPQQKWNNPRINMYRVLSANFSFVIMGMNDAAYGVCYTAPFFAEFRTDFFLIGPDSICKFGVGYSELHFVLTSTSS